MGLIDAFKRRKLTQKGMSSGKKRRTHGQWSLTDSMDRSLGIRLSLYLIFVILSSFLVVNNVDCIVQNIAEAVFLNIAISVGLIMIFEIQHNHKPRNTRVFLIYVGVMVQMVFIQFVSAVTHDFNLMILALPYAMAPMISSVLLGKQAGVFTTMAVTLCGMMIVSHQSLMEYVVMSLFSGMTVIFLTKNVRRRSSLLRAGFYAGLVTLILAVMFGLIEVPANTAEWKGLAIKSGSAVGVSILVSMVISGMLPLLEGIFKITTDISWLELSDLNHRLLKRMQMEAPGTFHHSLVVASLAEAAAERIGANASMCRVCAYFHDIGKLNKPEYFIENQGDENPHDSITPTMSALVIIAHVKDGVDLAVKHKLNPLIIDVIKEHHGDSLVYYFYDKAKKLRRTEKGKVEKGLEKAEDVSDVGEKSFRYPGPTPSSKESGIISLADAIESASRTIRNPTPSKIKALVDEIVMNRLSEGQLDNCSISVRELKKVKESFAKSLQSMLHSRIDYPKDSDKSRENSRVHKESRDVTKSSELYRDPNLKKVANNTTARIIEPNQPQN